MIRSAPVHTRAHPYERPPARTFGLGLRPGSRLNIFSSKSTKFASKRASSSFNRRVTPGGISLERRSAVGLEGIARGVTVSYPDPARVRTARPSMTGPQSGKERTFFSV